MATSLARGDHGDECVYLRTAAVRALEALEVGDQDEAVAILLSVQEYGAHEARYTCPLCSLGLRWYGQLEAHLARVHALTWDELEAVVARAA